MANPYELRWELLQAAENRLINRYTAQQERYHALIETNRDPGEYPEYPTDEKIKELAEYMKDYISDEGED